MLALSLGAGVAAAWLAAAVLMALRLLHQGVGALHTAPWLPWRLYPWARAHDPSIVPVMLWGGLGAAAWVGYTLSRGPTHEQTVYGSARWRALRDVAPLLWVGRWGPGRPHPPGGFVVGAPAPDRVVLLPAATEHHTVLLGATGSGKTWYHILPSLVAMGLARHSLIVPDLKGELAPRIGPWLTTQGYAVRVLDFADPSPASAQWNPQMPVIQAIMDGDLARASKAAWDLGHLLAGDRPTGDDQNAFWRQSQEALIAALVLAVSDVAPPEAAHLPSVLRTLVQYQNVLDGWFASFPDRHPAREAYSNVQLSTDVTRMGIVTTTAAQLRLFADPQMAWLASGQDPLWPMGQDLHGDLAWLRQPVAVFLRMPKEETRAPLVTLFLHQLIQTLVEVAETLPGRTLPAPTWFLLDEFGNLPALPGFARDITLLRSYGFRFVLALQNLQQLAKRYPGDDGTILDNCGTWVYLSTNGLDNAKALSERIGQRTVQVRSTSQQSGGHSVTVSPTGRPLVTPEDLLHWPKGQVLVLQQGVGPLRVPNRVVTKTVWASAITPGDPPPAQPLPPVTVWPPPAEDAADPDAWDAVPVLTDPVDPDLVDSLPF